MSNTSIMLSINPQYVELILNGTKKYEYRKKVAKKSVDKIYIYSTAPVKKIVGEVEVKRILALEPENLWRNTKEHSGVTRLFYDNYFSGKSIAYAYELGKIKKYNSPKSLNDFGINKAPQSFIYIEDNHIDTYIRPLFH